MAAALEGGYRRENLTTTFPGLWLKGILSSPFSPSPSLPLPLHHRFVSFHLPPSFPLSIKLLTLSILAEWRQRREGPPPSLQSEEQSSPGKSVKSTVSQQHEGGANSAGPRRNGTGWDQHTNIFLGGVRGTALMWPQAAEGETRWGLSPELRRDNLEKRLLCAVFQGPSLIPGFAGRHQRKKRKQKHFGLWCWIYCLEKEESWSVQKQKSSDIWKSNKWCLPPLSTTTLLQWGLNAHTKLVQGVVLDEAQPSCSWTDNSD